MVCAVVILASALSLAACGEETLPVSEGAEIFAASCASCHAFDGHDGKGGALKKAQSAPDLKTFGTADWIEGLLNPDKITSERYFKGTAFVSEAMGGAGKKNSKMVDFVLNELDIDSGQRRALAEALTKQEDGGWKLLVEEAGCLDCHSAGAGDGLALDLSDYGTRQWMIDFISDPASNHFYGKSNDRMPSFSKEGGDKLTMHQIETVVEWLQSSNPSK